MLSSRYAQMKIFYFDGGHLGFLQCKPTKCSEKLAP